MKYFFIFFYIIHNVFVKSFLQPNKLHKHIILYGTKSNIEQNNIVKFNKEIRNNKNKENNLLGTFDYKILEYLKKISSQKYIIMDKKNKKIYDKKIIKKKFNKKKIVSISPGGIQGFYFMGIMDFIKENYDLSDVFFTGASAGAWVSLFSSYKYNTTDFVQEILNCNFSNTKTIMELQLTFKKIILEKYQNKDFILENIFLGVTVLKGFKFSTNIFYNFENLEDAIDCCIASSHIPFLTGGIINKYNNEISFDGGFSNSPYLDINNTIFNINPSLWNKKEEKKDFINYHELTINSNHNFTQLYNKGYNNAKKNKKKLDQIFIYH